ncbi:MAG: hypothetical protein BGO98_19980 [Myxococcales bacterium 68-20]|nr:dienelactone hydrolase family protein [Myxococcales bacterium]OJY22568.1 MAG: hypothetical protein BGO98_19980 [Myxococcales bacterium 68-20]
MSSVFSCFSCVRTGALSLVLVSSFVLVAVAGCSDEPAPSEPTKRVNGESSLGCGNADAPKGVLANQTVTVRNNKRTYQAVVPDAHDGKTLLPIVFMFHGSGGDGAGLRSAYDLESEAQGQAIFVYPDADRASGTWDLERGAENNRDILTFDAILETLSSSHCVDRKRVFATGYSAGGYFSNQLACRRGSVLRAIASHAGGGPFGQNVEYGDDGKLRCPERPIAALIAHGTDDTTVKLEEAQQSREHWRRVNACASGGGTPRDPAPCVSLAACAEDRPVVYCEIPGLGHSVWPEKGAKVTWDFFASF